MPPYDGLGYHRRRAHRRGTDDRRTRVDDPAEQLRLAGQRRRPRATQLGEPGERPRQIVDRVDAVRQRGGVLQTLTAALAEVGAHRMSGVADQDDGTAPPVARRLAVVEVVAENVGRVGGGQQRGDGIGPTAVPGPEVGEFAGGETLPSG